MTSKNSKICDLYRLLLNITNEMDLQRSDKRVAFSDLSVYYTWRNIKRNTTTINLKNWEQHEMKNLKYLIDLYSFKILTNISNRLKCRIELYSGLRLCTMLQL